MKIKLFICILLLFISILIPNVSASKATIVIDPGHGGIDSGAGYKEIYEKNINLEIALSLRDVLLAEGFNVILTRSKDESLNNGKFNKKEDMANRVNIINNSDAILCISIHLNYFTDPKYYGAQVFYSNNHSDNIALAEGIQSSLRDYIGNNNRKIVCRDNVYLLNHSVIPTCLIECGFLSNEEERNKLLDKNYQLILAKAIYFGIRRSYFPLV